MHIAHASASEVGKVSTPGDSPSEGRRGLEAQGTDKLLQPCL